MKENIYILLGVVSEVYPEYMTDYAQRLVNLYIGALKAEVRDIVFVSSLKHSDTGNTLSVGMSVCLPMCLSVYPVVTLSW